MSAPHPLPSPLSPPPSSCFLRHKPLFLSPLPLPLRPQTRPLKPSRPFLFRAQSKGSNSADAPDRLISAVCYFYPFFDGVQYGKYVVTQFSPIAALIQPLLPAIKAFKSFPFNGFLVFLTLYFVVVRNPNFSRWVLRQPLHCLRCITFAWLRQFTLFCLSIMSRVWVLLLENGSVL